MIAGEYLEKKGMSLYNIRKVLYSINNKGKNYDEMRQLRMLYNYLEAAGLNYEQIELFIVNNLSCLDLEKKEILKIAFTLKFTDLIDEIFEHRSMIRGLTNYKRIFIRDYISKKGKKYIDSLAPTFLTVSDKEAYYAKHSLCLYSNNFLGKEVYSDNEAEIELNRILKLHDKPITIDKLIDLCSKQFYGNYLISSLKKKHDINDKKINLSKEESREEYIKKLIENNETYKLKLEKLKGNKLELFNITSMKFDVKDKEKKDEFYNILADYIINTRRDINSFSLNVDEILDLFYKIGYSEDNIVDMIMKEPSLLHEDKDKMFWKILILGKVYSRKTNENVRKEEIIKNPKMLRMSNDLMYSRIKFLESKEGQELLKNKDILTIRQITKCTSREFENSYGKSKEELISMYPFDNNAQLDIVSWPENEEFLDAIFKGGISK